MVVGSFEMTMVSFEIKLVSFEISLVNFEKCQFWNVSNYRHVPSQFLNVSGKLFNVSS